MRRRILIVDDEPGMLRAVRRVLQDPYEVRGAASAEQALEIFADFAPDLAVLDIRMPGRDGFELMTELKKADPDLDVILMSGSLGETDQKLIRAIRQKAFYYIQKPFEREVLRTLVERCLELRRLSEENRRHVRRLEAVLSDARTFQRGLLPPPAATLGRVSLLARLVSCDELCGDFYDYALCPSGAVAFLLADVAGHGASAAMLTGVVKSAFRSCHAEGYEPRAVAERIGAGIRTFGANRFVTLFCGRIEPGEGGLTYVNAGHPPSLAWCPGGAPEWLAPTGPLISPVLDKARWEQLRVAFGRGHRLLAYTDGITETGSDSDAFGGDRIREAVLARAAGGEGLLDDLLDAVRAFAKGRPQRDDLTLLTVSAD